MAESGVHVKQTNDERKYLDVERYIIPFSLKEAITTIDICKPIEQEPRTSTHLDLTSHLQWNPEEINQEEISSKDYETLLHASKTSTETKYYLI